MNKIRQWFREMWCGLYWHHYFWITEEKRNERCPGCGRDERSEFNKWGDEVMEYLRKQKGEKK